MGSIHSQCGIGERTGVAGVGDDPRSTLVPQLEQGATSVVCLIDGSDVDDERAVSDHRERRVPDVIDALGAASTQTSRQLKSKASRSIVDIVFQGISHCHPPPSAL